MKRDPDHMAGTFLYALAAGVSFGIWRDSYSAGLFVFFTLFPLFLALD